MQPLQDEMVTRHVLAKQHLLASHMDEDIIQVVSDIVALHATSVATPYISLFARTAGFQPAQLDRELYTNRRLIRLHLMRDTLFIVPTTSAPVLFRATRPSEQTLQESLARWGVSPSEYEEVARAVVCALKGHTQTLSELKRVLPERMVRSVRARIGNLVYNSTNLRVITDVMVERGILLSEKGPGVTSPAAPNRLSLLRDVYPELDLESIGEAEARTTLIENYINAFGPVTIEDIGWWMGSNITDVRRSLSTIEPRLIHVEISGSDRDYLMSESDYRRYMQSTESMSMPSDPLCLLPYEDPFVKGYKIRDRLIAHEYERQAYSADGTASPTILLNGRIIGTWNRFVENRSQEIQLRLFESVPSVLEERLIRLAEQLSKTMTGHELKVTVS